MSFIDILFTGVGLSMDAFAVSICKGLMIREKIYVKAIVVGLYFGFFQMIMPLVGFYLGSIFNSSIFNYGYWISFFTLSFIGFNMIRDADNEENSNDSISFVTMIPLAIATSIDALTIGFTFSFFKIDIIMSVIVIGIITFFVSFVGVFMGNVFGSSYRKKSQILGGLILLLISFKIIIEHLI